MNIVVTGGAGFIGSHFIRHLLASYPDYEVINVDNLSYCGNLDNLKSVESDTRYTFIRADITDSERMGEILSRQVDFIVNFAAQTHVDRSIQGGLEFVRTNVYGTAVLLEAVRTCNVKRFLHVSTDEVYGSIESGSFDETSRLSPNSPYAASKAAADLLCRSYGITHRVPVCIVRSANNFGPCQYPEKIIPLFITNLLDDKTVPLYGDGKNVRDWVYVGDNCRAIDLVLHRGEVGQIYNVGAGNEIPNIELAKKILQAVGKDENCIEYVSDRPGHDRRYSLDCRKIRDLGFEPRCDFSEALRETVSWYRDNRRWWEKVKEREGSLR